MGNYISAIRSQLDQSSKAEEEMHQRLNILEKMVHYHLDIAKTAMLNGERGDQEIHTGTVVAFKKEVLVKLNKGSSGGSGDSVDKKGSSGGSGDSVDKKGSSGGSGDSVDKKGSSGGSRVSVEGMIKDFFGGHIMSGVEKLILTGVNTIIGNDSMGEHEDSSMFIVWSDNSLLRLDTYIYKWKFLSEAVISDTEMVTGVATMTRVIDLTKTDPQVLTWAVTRQAHSAGEDPNQAISEVVEVIKKVSSLQQAVRAIEVEEHTKGIAEEED